MNGLASAKIALEKILQREWSLRGAVLKEYLEEVSKRHLDVDPELDKRIAAQDMRTGFVIRKIIPEIIAQGSGQLVLGIGNGYVAKMPANNQTPSYYVGGNSIFIPTYEETIAILREIGLQVPGYFYAAVEKRKGKVSIEYKANEGSLIGRLCAFIITANLAENGAYIVEDAEERHFKELKNGASLKQELSGYIKILKAIYDGANPKYNMKITRHAENVPEEAIRHMFFMQIDPKLNTGKLVLGDLDHIALYRKSA